MCLHAILVAGIQLGAEQQHRRDLSGYLLHMPDLLGQQRPCDGRMVALAQPLLQHLIAADPAFPNLLGSPFSGPG